MAILSGLRIGQPRFILALTGVLLSIGLTHRAPAQITAENLIGEAVSEPNAARYADVTEAIKRYAGNDTLGAKTFLERAKTKEARLPPANLMMAKLYFFDRKTRAYLQSLEVTARESPNEPEPYLLLADQALSQQQSVQAMALYDKAIELIGNYDENARRKRKLAIRAYAGRSTVRQRWQDWAGSEADLKAWLKEDPDAASAHYRLGQVLFMQGTDKEAEGYKSFEKAKELNESLSQAPVSAAVMYQRLANDADDSEKEKKYRALARKAFELGYNKKDAKIDGKKDPTTLISFGEFLIRSGKLDEANKLLTGARQVQPTSHQIQLLSGVLAEMQAKPQEAEQFYNRTIALAPGNRDASNQLALLLIRSDDEEVQARAEAVARLNARLNENNADVNITLAWVLNERGKAAEATQAFQRGVQLGQPSADSTLLVAKLLIERNRKKDARELLERAMKNEQGIFVQRNEAEALLKTL